MSLIALPVISFLAVILSILPCAWHCRVRNTSILTLVGWLITVNFCYFINSVVWKDNVTLRTPVWCDISKLHHLVYFHHKCETNKLLFK